MVVVGQCCDENFPATILGRSVQPSCPIRQVAFDGGPYFVPLFEVFARRWVYSVQPLRVRQERDASHATDGSLKRGNRCEQWRLRPGMEVNRGAGLRSNEVSLT